MKPLLLAIFLLSFHVLGPGCARAESKPPLDFVELVLHGKPEDKLPLLVAVHGLGDAPEHFIELFKGLDVPVRIVAPRAPDPFEQGTSWFPIDDPKRAPQGILDRAALLARFVEHVAATRPTRGLPVVTGFSQGGILSFALAAYHPKRLGATLPIAGMLLDSLPRYQKAPKGFRITAFHGKEDRRVPYSGGVRTAARFKALGTPVTLSSYDGVGHFVSPAMESALAAALREELARVAP